MCSNKKRISCVIAKLTEIVDFLTIAVKAQSRYHAIGF